MHEFIRCMHETWWSIITYTAMIIISCLAYIKWLSSEFEN